MRLHSKTVLCTLAILLGCGSERAAPIRLPEPAATINRLIDDRGVFSYAIRSSSAPDVPDLSSEATALVVMRRPADMRPIGGSYYDDGFGNLVRFGQFKAPALGGASRYALTFRRNGGMQLALDLRNDAIVDVLVEVGLDGRFGAMADPDLQWFLECLSGQLRGGMGMADAATACLARAGEGGGGGSGGLTPDVARDIDRLGKPDCEERGGAPGSVTQGSSHESTTVIEMDNGDRIKATVSENADGSSTYRIEVHDKHGRLVYRETSTLDSNGQEKRSEVRRVTYDDATGGVTDEYTRREHGKEVEHDVVEVGGAEWESEPAPAPDPGPIRQPGPECEDCPVEDPRCAPAPNDIASLWDCQAQTGKSLWECLERLQDVIYSSTGGRCSTEPGPDDRPTIRCSDRRLGECLAEGRSVVDCLRKNRGFGGGDDSPGPENDYLRDRIGESKGQAGLYIDATPMAAVFIAFCREGVEQFCRGGRGRF